jgi:hypothetical protein
MKSIFASELGFVEKYDYKVKFINLFLQSLGTNNLNYTNFKKIRIDFVDNIINGDILFYYIDEFLELKSLSDLNESLDFELSIILPFFCDEYKAEDIINFYTKNKDIYVWIPILRKEYIKTINEFINETFDKDLTNILEIIKKMYLEGWIYNQNKRRIRLNYDYEFPQIIMHILNINENINDTNIPTISFNNDDLLDPTKWRTLLLFLKEFNLNNKYNYSINSQNQIWKNIIGIQKIWKEDIEQTIRINSQLAYLIEEEKQLRDINNNLFKLHFVFDQEFYQYDNNSIPGLKRLLNIIISTYGDTNIFLLEINNIKSNLSFIEKKFDQNLIKEYKYLKNISLPLRGYENLRIALITLLKKFSHLKLIITNPELYNELMDDINNFKKKYINVYQTEHQKFQNKVNSFNKKLHNMQEYRVLEYLSMIQVIRVAYNMKPIKKYIDTFFPEKCELEDIENILMEQPKCRCGYILGENLATPSLNKIKPMLKKGIIEYIEQLQNTKYFKELLIAYINENPYSNIKKILDINTNMNIDNLIEIIDLNLINEINKALCTSYSINISLSELCKKIIGIYSGDQIDLLINKIHKELLNIIKIKLNEIGKTEADNLLINIIK